jgi:UDPglucose--hexose-1-phosphate uridylyltransferase
LKKEMEELAACIREGKDPAQVPELEKHAAWTQEILTRRPQLAQMDVEAVLREEIGKVFVRVLENAGVYKCTQEGRAAFGRFTASLNQ